jgi:hypothetical protein
LFQLKSILVENYNLLLLTEHWTVSSIEPDELSALTGNFPLCLGNVCLMVNTDVPVTWSVCVSNPS